MNAGSVSPTPAAGVSAGEVEAMVCPRCGQGHLMTGRRAWGCSRWREGCTLVVPFAVGGKALTAAHLRELVTPETLAEFRADPHGARGRSQALAQVLNFIRMQPIEDRVFAYAEVPFRRYKLGSMHAERGVPPEIDASATYATEDEPIYAVFVRRLELLGIAPEAGR